MSAQIIERVDRKTLFLGSGILAIISQGIVGIFFLMKLNLKMDVSSISWIPLFGIAFYQIGSMTFVYSGRLFSLEVKGIGITLTNVAYDLVALFIKMQFQFAVNNFGIAFTFFSFVFCCAIGTGIVFYLAPETRGKSLKEIREIMDSGIKMKK